MTSPVTQRYSLIRGRMARVTKLDECGNIVPGSHNQVTTKGTISVGFTPVNDEGTTIDVTNANGDRCIYDQPAPKFRNFTLEIALCGVNPDLVTLLTGQDLALDAEGNRVGFKVSSDVDLDVVRFALELWSTIPGEECTDGVKSYGYLVVPLVQGGALGDFTWQNDAVNFTISGAQTKDGNAWGAGPYDVQLDEDDEPGPLVDSLEANDHLLVIATKVPPPPESESGSGPVGVPATTINAGIPATLEPDNSYPPADLADLIDQDPTADPATAWTTGQYVLLEDGSEAHWNGTAWVAGAA